MFKKQWLNPELKNLSVGCTNEEGECWLATQPTNLTPIPNGPNGVGHCPKWNGYGCTHQSYGSGQAKNWPCPQASGVLPGGDLPDIGVGVS